MATETSDTNERATDRGASFTVADVEAVLFPDLRDQHSAALLASVDVEVNVACSADMRRTVRLHLTTADIDMRLPGHQRKGGKGKGSGKGKKGATSATGAEGTTGESATTAPPAPRPAGVLPKDWKRRHYFWFRFDEGIRMDLEGFHEVTPESVSAYMAWRLRKCRKVVDGTAGCGGNLVQLAAAQCLKTGRMNYGPATGPEASAPQQDVRAFRKETPGKLVILGVDVIPERLKDCEHNLRVYGFQGPIRSRGIANNAFGPNSLPDQLETVARNHRRRGRKGAEVMLCPGKLEDVAQSLLEARVRGQLTGAPERQIPTRLAGWEELSRVAGNRKRKSKQDEATGDEDGDSSDSGAGFDESNEGENEPAVVEATPPQHDPLSFDAVVLSPPWGGSNHLDLPVFNFSSIPLDMCDARLLFASACALARNVILYLPRHQDLRELCELGSDFGFDEIEVESICFAKPHRHRKLLCVYYGKRLVVQREEEVLVEDPRDDRSAGGADHAAESCGDGGAAASRGRNHEDEKKSVDLPTTLRHMNFTYYPHGTSRMETAGCEVGVNNEFAEGMTALLQHRGVPLAGS